MIRALAFAALVLITGAGAAVACDARAAYQGPPLLTPPDAFDAAFPAFSPGAAQAPALDAAFARIDQRLNAAALTMAVARPGGAIWSHTRGAADENARFFWASAGKTFTAVAILQMVEAGQLSLDDRLSRWAPEFQNAELISIDDLLSHTSGLFSFNADEALRATPGYKDVDTALAAARAHPPLFCPGAGFSYSNTNYALLGRIIEAVDGRPYHEAVTARIVDRLGLRETSVITPQREPPGVPRPAPRPGGEATNGAADDMRTPYAAGAIIASAPDMLRFWRALLAGELLTRDTVRAQFASLRPMGGANYYGRGVMAYALAQASPNETDVWVGHSGGMPGVKAVVAYSTEHDAFVAVALTGEGSPEAAALHLLQSLQAR